MSFRLSANDNFCWQEECHKLNLSRWALGQATIAGVIYRNQSHSEPANKCTQDNLQINIRPYIFANTLCNGLSSLGIYDTTGAFANRSIRVLFGGETSRGEERSQEHHFRGPPRGNIEDGVLGQEKHSAVE